MENNFKPKENNSDKGFNYSVTPEQLKEYAKWTWQERLHWIFETNEFLSKVQTNEERERARIIKHKVAF